MNRTWWLYVLGVIAALLSFPYPPKLLALIAGEVAVILLIWAGLWFGSRNQLGSAIPSPRQAALALLIGVVSGGVVLALLPLAGLQSRIIKESSIPLWKWLIIAFDSAVLEEIVFRLFGMSFVVWLLGRFVRRNPAIWVALVLSGLLFGAAHLSRWIESGPMVITAVMIVNGAIAIVLGLVYVKWGIEAAMLSHFAGDVVLHIIGPHFFI
jgi:membrane protease YdiL (CAAX protease family)